MARKISDNTTKARGHLGALSERFPLLSLQPGIPTDVREDLLLTDLAFGEKYRRGKAARLEVLENMELRLAVPGLRKRNSELEILEQRLAEIMSVDERAVSRCLAPPVTLAQARVVFELTFLRPGAKGPEFTVDTSLMLDRLKGIPTDELAVDIVKSLILDVSGEGTPQDLADRYGLGRQAIYDRQARLVTRLDEMIQEPDFSTLIDVIHSEACTVRGKRLVASTAHPLVSILLLEGGEFPSVRDLVAVGLWGVARTETHKKDSFRVVQRAGAIYSELELVIP